MYRTSVGEVWRSISLRPSHRQAVVVVSTLIGAILGGVSSRVPGNAWAHNQHFVRACAKSPGGSQDEGSAQPDSLRKNAEIDGWGERDGRLPASTDTRQTVPEVADSLDTPTVAFNDPNRTPHQAPAGTIVYVDRDATGPSHDGTSWCEGHLNLQGALASAAPGTTIRVANGTYYPDRGGQQTLGDRNATFHLKNGVIIEGGYAGCTAPDPDAHDITGFETILSGDLASDDNPNPISNCCSAHSSIYCDDLTCALAVCHDNPRCCDTRWDELCASP